MQTLSLLAPTVAILLTAGCATEPEGESFVFEDGGDDKADSLAGKTILPVIREARRILTYESLDGIVDADLDSSLTKLTLSTELNVSYNQSTEPVLYEVKSNSLGDTVTGTRLGITLMRNDDIHYSTPKPWAGVKCSGRSGTISAFDSVVVDTQRKTITSPRATFTFAECGLPDTLSMLGVFVVPMNNWFSLEGTFHYTITATPTR